MKKFIFAALIIAAITTPAFGDIRTEVNAGYDELLVLGGTIDILNQSCTQEQKDTAITKAQGLVDLFQRLDGTGTDAQNKVIAANLRLAEQKLTQVEALAVNEAAESMAEPEKSEEQAAQEAAREGAKAAFDRAVESQSPVDYDSTETRLSNLEDQVGDIDTRLTTVEDYIKQLSAAPGTVIDVDIINSAINDGYAMPTGTDYWDKAQKIIIGKTLRIGNSYYRVGWEDGQWIIIPNRATFVVQPGMDWHYGVWAWDGRWNRWA